VKKWLIVVLVALLTACGGEQESSGGETVVEAKTYKWKLVTSWPKNYPGLGVAPQNFANMVDEMSAGRLKIKVYGAGELVPALEVFDAVSQGTAEMGHSGAYYWKGKSPAVPFFSSTPFGLNAQEMNSWLHYGGGLELWREIYAPFNLIPFAGGNSGVQMGGWFNREINSIEDLKGLKMRLPGFGGEVLTRVGGESVTIAGGELYTSLQTNLIDATEWVGPYNDLAFGFYQVAKYYYYPGWHETGTTLEFTVNKTAYEQLPKDLQKIIEVAARAINQDMLDEYTARNNDALTELIDKHGVELRAFPDEVLNALRQASEEVLSDLAAADPMVARVYESQMRFKKGVMRYHEISEEAAYKARRPR
jgi:TRAP-type mannitol/chloroaromatic compound transport system substrate-binding protein